MLPLGVSSNLFKSAIIVAGTWTAIFSLFSLREWRDIPFNSVLGLITAVVGTSIGAAAYFVLRKTIAIQEIEAAAPSPGVTVNLHTGSGSTKNHIIDLPPPFPRSNFKRSKLTKQVIAELSRWGGYAEYGEKFPAHKRAFDAIAQIIASRPNLKASHVAGGHGNHTLLAHSVNVVKAATLMQWRYRYYGLYRGGKLTRPVSDQRGYFMFSKDDPIIPLAALAHDIGKIITYEEEDGKIVKTRDAHDIPGRRLLQYLPEIYDLPIEDRHALMMAVGYYHHLHGGVADGIYQDGVPYSDWVTDRIYAICHFLEYVDIQTGRIEGSKSVEPFFVPDWAKSSPSKQADSLPERMPSSADGEPVQQEREAGLRTETETGPGIEIDWMVEFIKAEARRKSGKGLAHRHGNWLYIMDTDWRRWVKESKKPVENPESLLRQPSEGHIHPVTRRLLEQLGERGLVLTEAGGLRYNPVNALYTVAVTRQDGTKAEQKFMIVVSTEICREAMKIKESLYSLVPVRSSFGEQKALKHPRHYEKTELSCDAHEDGALQVEQRAGDHGNAENALAATDLSVDDNPQTGQEDDSPDDDSMESTIEDFLNWLSEIQSMKNPDVPPFADKKIGEEKCVMVSQDEIPVYMANLDIAKIAIGNIEGMLAIPYKLLSVPKK